MGFGSGPKLSESNEELLHYVILPHPLSMLLVLRVCNVLSNCKRDRTRYCIPASPSNHLTSWLSNSVYSVLKLILLNSELENILITEKAWVLEIA